MLIPIAKRLVRSLSRTFDKKNVEKSRSSFFDEIIAYIRQSLPCNSCNNVYFNISEDYYSEKRRKKKEREEKSVGGIIEGIKRSDRSEIRRDG